MAGLGLLRAMNFFIVEDFLDAETCARMRESMESAPSIVAKVLKEDRGVEEVDERVRSTRRIEVADTMRAEVVSALESVRDRAGSHFGVTLTETEKPQFLVYREGDFFQKHMDMDHNERYRRAVSTILFLNDDYKGGALKFYGGVERKLLELTLPPKQGMLVGFRADWIHEVEPVRSGIRYTVVSWFG